MTGPYRRLVSIVQSLDFGTLHGPLLYGHPKLSDETDRRKVGMRLYRDRRRHFLVAKLFIQNAV